MSARWIALVVPLFVAANGIAGARRLRAEGAPASLAEARVDRARAEAGRLQPSDQQTVRDGVYTADQAKRGKSVYDTKCASCHDGGTMGPELWGDPFLADWDNKPVDAFFSRIQKTMPEDAPGTLSEGEILDVIAYVLQTNGFQAGDKAITSASALATVRFVRKP